MKGNVFKLKVDRFRLDKRNIFFDVKAVRHWNNLSREVVNAPSLETLKVGCNFEQPGLMEDILPDYSGLGKT